MISYDLHDLDRTGVKSETIHKGRISGVVKGCLAGIWEDPSLEKSKEKLVKKTIENVKKITAKRRKEYFPYIKTLNNCTGLRASTGVVLVVLFVVLVVLVF